MTKRNKILMIMMFIESLILIICSIINHMYINILEDKIEELENISSDCNNRIENYKQDIDDLRLYSDSLSSKCGNNGE